MFWENKYILKKNIKDILPTKLISINSQMATKVNYPKVYNMYNFLFTCII